MVKTREKYEHQKKNICKDLGATSENRGKTN